MKIKFYGVRGSIPVPGRSTMRYGGNTTCVSISKEVKGKIYRIIIDCGSGARVLGKEIINNYFNKKEDLNFTLLFTHLHPDHIQGFPFFAPNYFNDCNISLMGMKCLKKHVGIVLEQSMLPPTFPLEYKDLKSKRKHYELRDCQSFNKYDAFNIQVMQAFAPSHPQQGCLYYKITDLETSKSVACIWDIESHTGGDKAVIKFAKDCNLMMHDTQYTKEEYENDKIIVQGFGHSTYEMAIENAKQADIKDRLVCTHFAPDHTDEFLDKIQHKFFKNNILLAYEGLEVNI